MKTFFSTRILTVAVAVAVSLHLVGALFAAAQNYKLNFVPSPDETNNAVLAYVGVWTPTNSFATNSLGTNWYVFANVVVGSTQFTIPSTVPSPAYLAVRTEGTNYLLSAPTNLVLYSTQALALIYTNQPAPPRAPSAPTLSQ